jgi:hypothetical protein
VRSCVNPCNSLVLDPAHDSAKEIARRVIEGGNFTNVSKEAMCFRLLDLGLLVDRAGRSLSESLEARWRKGEEDRKGSSAGCVGKYTR